MDLAASLAQREHSELYIGHAWSPKSAELLQTRPSGLTEEEINDYINETQACNERRLNELMGRAEAWAGEDIWREVKPQTRLVKGLARRAIPDLAEELQAELIVMGTLGQCRHRGYSHRQHGGNHTQPHRLFGAGNQAGGICHPGDATGIRSL